MAGTASKLVRSGAALDAPVRAGWEALRRRVHAVVQECNWEAGEAMWMVAEESGGNRLRIWDQTRECSCVELWLDGERRALCCRFGLPPHRGDWDFQVMPDGATLRRAATTLCIAEAVDAILDHLVSR